MSIALAGCTPSSERREAAIYPVDGQLSFEGKPAIGAVVTLHPQSPESAGQAYEAIVRPDGHFVPTQANGAVGIPAGTYHLTAAWPLDGADRWSGKYSSPDQPVQKITVDSTITIIPKIELP